MGLWMRSFGTMLLMAAVMLVVLMSYTKVEPIGILFVVLLFGLGIAFHISAPRGGK